MNLLTAIKTGPARRTLAGLWHRLAPAVTVSRTVWDLRVCFDLRDNIDDLTRSRAALEGREPDMQHVLRRVPGPVWDVGCNIGLFTFAALRTGHPVVAFDMSEKAVGLLARTVRRNGLDVTAVARALTVAPMTYSLPRTSYKGNRMAARDGVMRESLTVDDAVRCYGTPRLLKMDIEGGERAFFESEAFRNWILTEDIAWLVELHPQYGGTLEWPDVPHLRLPHGPVALYHRDAAFLETVRPSDAV